MGLFLRAGQMQLEELSVPFAKNAAAAASGPLLRRDGAGCAHSVAEPLLHRLGSSEVAWKRAGVPGPGRAGGAKKMAAAPRAAAPCTAAQNKKSVRVRKVAGSVQRTPQQRNSGTGRSAPVHILPQQPHAVTYAHTHNRSHYTPYVFFFIVLFLRPPLPRAADLRVGHWPRHVGGPPRPPFHRGRPCPRLPPQALLLLFGADPQPVGQQAGRAPSRDILVICLLSLLLL
jgi:hypothetical protein